MRPQQVIALAGASGDLGFRIARALVDRGASLRALVRRDVSPAERTRLQSARLGLAEVDWDDKASVAAACAGATCVVSALNGLRTVVVDRQGMLLDAALQAGVPRFISSDYSADFTKTRPGENRNLDLRRDFMVRTDRASIAVTSIFNGAFMDLLGGDMPIIRNGIRRVLYWSDADQLLDFTTKDDVAAYVSAAALDQSTPRIMRIAGDTVSARDIASAMTEVTGERFRTLWVGSIGTLGVLINAAKIFAPQPEAVFPPWQGMQYMRDQFNGRGKLSPLDNQRYSDLRWTSVAEHLESRFANGKRALVKLSP